MNGPQSTDPIGLDKHDPAGMAAWLRERGENTRTFMALTSDQQRLQFLERWQQYVLPHLAFRFEQAAEMIERQQLTEKEGWAYAEQLEQSILAISAYCPMSAGTRTRLANLVRASVRAGDASVPLTPAGKLLGVEIPPPCSCGSAGGFDPLCWHHGVKHQSEEAPT